MGQRCSGSDADRGGAFRLRRTCWALALLAAGIGGTAGAVSAQSPAAERPEAMVRAIYNALDGRSEGLQPSEWTEPEVARRLFVPDLAALAVEEGRRAVPDRRVPFDPFTGALQIRPRQVGVKIIAVSQTQAELSVRFTVSHTLRTVGYRLARRADGWRIADIWWGTDKRRSFRRLLD